MTPSRDTRRRHQHQVYERRRLGAGDCDTCMVLPNLQSILCTPLPLYCAFVDYRKAFDMIDRSSLWQKLLKLNIKGKVLNVIINAYNGAKSCVKLNRSMSDYFSCNIGVRQGENLSPLLFAIYLNDLETYFVGNCNGINPFLTARKHKFTILMRQWFFDNQFSS